jgi:YggT family protein
MIFLGNLLQGLGSVLNLFLGFFLILVIARAVISWVSADPYNPLVRFILSTTDPLLRPIQRKIRPLNGTIDLSPLILLAVIYFLQFALVANLQIYGAELVRDGMMAR